jgi:hypothetical protein
MGSIPSKKKFFSTPQQWPGLEANDDDDDDDDDVEAEQNNSPEYGK